jgi:hypothetical protein
MRINTMSNQPKNAFAALSIFVAGLIGIGTFAALGQLTVLV